MTALSLQKNMDKIASEMMKTFGYKNKMASPKLEKIVINVGVGRKDDKEREELKKNLEFIVGQKLIDCQAKKAIAGFKTRQGMVIGYKATLRGIRMYDFFYRLINVAIPRMRDFRGIDVKSVDKKGNLTIGIREHIVFPEMIGEDIRSIFGFEISLVSTAKNREEALEFYKLIGVPFSVKGGSASGGKK